MTTTKTEKCIVDLNASNQINTYIWPKGAISVIFKIINNIVHFQFQGKKTV